MEFVKEDGGAALSEFLSALHVSNPSHPQHSLPTEIWQQIFKAVMEGQESFLITVEYNGKVTTPAHVLLNAKKTCKRFNKEINLLSYLPSDISLNVKQEPFNQIAALKTTSRVYRKRIKKIVVPIKGNFDHLDFPALKVVEFEIGESRSFSLLTRLVMAKEKRGKEDLKKAVRLSVYQDLFYSNDGERKAAVVFDEARSFKILARLAVITVPLNMSSVDSRENATTIWTVLIDCDSGEILEENKEYV